MENKRKMRLIDFVIIIISIILAVALILFFIYKEAGDDLDYIEEFNETEISENEESENEDYIDVFDYINKNADKTEKIANLENVDVYKDLDKNEVEKNLSKIEFVNSDKIKWVEYPKDILNSSSFKKSYGNEPESFYKLDYEDPDEEYDLFLKTLYELSKQDDNDNKDIIEDFIFRYADGTGFTNTTSNYKYYSDFIKRNSDFKRYIAPIEIQLSHFNENWLYYKDTEIINNYDSLYIATQKQYYSNKYGFIYNKYMDGDMESFNNQYFGVRHIEFINGNTKSKDDYENNARAKDIIVMVNNEEYKVKLDDTNELQIFDINYKGNIDKPLEIKIDVVSAYKGKETDDIYISDVIIDSDAILYGGGR